MRLIDAGQLVDDINNTVNWNTNNEYNIYSDIIDLIDNSETKNRFGHLNKTYLYGGEIVYSCSNCGARFGSSFIEDFKHNNYCSDCGVKWENT